MNSKTFVERAKREVADYINSSNPEHVYDEITADDVQTVWFSKALQNAKVILYVPQHSGFLYEVTYNGTKEELYIDEYNKTRNIKIVV